MTTLAVLLLGFGLGFVVGVTLARFAILHHMARMNRLANKTT